MKTNVSLQPPTGSTPEQARAWFVANGIAVTDWCKAHKLDRYTVNDLLNGSLKGRRGKAHRAAIALGLKADPKSSTRSHTKNRAA